MKHHEHHEHHGRHHRATGGVNEAEMDLRDEPEARTYAKEIDHEAEERKHGGHVKHKRHARKTGGGVMHAHGKAHSGIHGMHHEGFGPEHHTTTKRTARKRGGKALHGVQEGEGFGLQDRSTKTHRRHGGAAKHHSAKHLGHVHGEHAKHHAGRKPRKAGGKVGSDSHPFTSAYHGEAPKGRKLDLEMD